MGSFDGIRFASKAAKIWGGGGNCPLTPRVPPALNLILALHLAVNRTIEKIFVRVFYEPIVQIEDHSCAQIR